MTRALDVDGGVAVEITSTDPAATASIRARGSSGAVFYCESAKEPPGWMEDDCFKDRTPSGSPCPIMARGASASVAEIDGGVRITMRPLRGLPLLKLRRDIADRAAKFPHP